MSNTKKQKSSTAQNWNIKGIEPETRQKVTKAAKKSGITIGAYVNRVLLEKANEDLSRIKPEVPAKMEDIQSQLMTMNATIIQLANKLDQPKETLWRKIFK